MFHRTALVYIGSSANCFSRFATHENDKEFDEYFIIDTDELSREEMYELERKYIARYCPPLNKCYNAMVFREWARKIEEDKKERQHKSRISVQ